MIWLDYIFHLAIYFLFVPSVYFKSFSCIPFLLSVFHFILLTSLLHSLYFIYYSKQTKQSHIKALFYFICLLSYTPRNPYNSFPHCHSAHMWPWEAFLHHLYLFSLLHDLIFHYSTFTTWCYIYTCLLIFFFSSD